MLVYCTSLFVFEFIFSAWFQTPYWYLKQDTKKIFPICGDVLYVLPTHACRADGVFQIDIELLGAVQSQGRTINNI